MKKAFGFVLLSIISIHLSIADEGIKFSVSGNPIVRDIYTADPSAHVWEDGRLYVYPSQDIAPPRGCDLMDKYHVYSTDDMVNWIDHGQILEAADVPWGQPLKDGGTFMWAPDCAYKNGKYYFYFPHPDKDPWNENWKIGIAISDKPASDFKVLEEPMKGLPSSAMIDPCVFVDDDGQAYFYYGGGSVCMGGKLKDNMTELDGELVRMTGLAYFHEGAWVHKKDGVYYLSYPGNNSSLPGYVQGQDQLLYATSDSPLGPWQYKGTYLRPTGCDTSHGSIVEYKGQWYAFYHNIALSGRGNLRSICVDKLFYNEDGRIQLVKQTRDMGSPYGGTPWQIPGVIEAEDFNEGGQSFGYYDNTVGNSKKEYRPKESVDINVNRNDVYYIEDTSTGEYLNYTIEVTETGIYEFDCISSSVTEASLGSIRLEFDGEETTSTEKTSIPVGSRTDFKTTTIKGIELTKGVHTMTLYTYDKLYIDKYIFRRQGTGIGSLEKESILVYPNPSDGIFNIKIPQSGYLTISDISGREIYSDNITDYLYTLDFSNKPAGIYILLLQSENQTYQSKIIKK